MQERLDFSTVWGKLTLTVLGTLAEIYIDNLRQETRKGKHQRARNGLWNGNIPYGYCRGNCSTCKDPNGAGYCPNYGKADLDSNSRQLIKHPIDSQVVPHIYQLYLSEEYSDARIARYIQKFTISLSDQEAIHPRTKGIPGRHAPGPFQKDYVRGLLTNIFYTGVVPYFGSKKGSKSSRMPNKIYQGKHLALISDSDFQTVQKLRKQVALSRRFKHGKKSRIYPLTGILHCGNCGSPFRGTSTKGRLYYKDASRVECYSCEQPTLKALSIEKKVASWLRRKLECPSLNDILHSQAKTLKDIDDRLERAHKLYLAGALEMKAYKKEQNRHNDLKKHLQENEPNAKTTLLETTQSQLSVWQNLSTTKQKRLLQVMIEAVFVQGNALVAIQPTIASLPLLREGCKSGPDGSATCSA